MGDSKSAIIFSDIEPIAFEKYKIYQLGTGYVALFDDDNEPVCLLCRMLDDKEISSFDKKAANKLILKSREGFMELTVLIISKSLKSIEEADDIINSLLREVNRYYY